MNRRSFIASSTALAGAGLTTALPLAAADAASGGAREFYELRLYHLRRGAKRKLFDEYVSQAAIPALNRVGVNPWAFSASCSARTARPCTP